MRLSISNIAWAVENDSFVYALMKELAFEGLEIAPTRVFPELPYGKLQAAAEWREKMSREHGFCVPSMQSIWYGRKECLFGSAEERAALVQYTEAAIDFAQAIGCRNLVFGCPKNRAVPEGMNATNAHRIAVDFFGELGEYAVAHGTVVGIEANPAIYGTNFVNRTEEALSLIEDVALEGVRLNLDVGTMIANDESVDVLRGKVHLVNHVHISEPYLKPIQHRSIHAELLSTLSENGYAGFVSIEMGKVDDLEEIRKAMLYVKEMV